MSLQRPIHSFIDRCFEMVSTGERVPPTLPPGAWLGAVLRRCILSHGIDGSFAFGTLPALFYRRGGRSLRRVDTKRPVPRAAALPPASAYRWSSHVRLFPCHCVSCPARRTRQDQVRRREAAWTRRDACNANGSTGDGVDGGEFFRPSELRKTSALPRGARRAISCGFPSPLCRPGSDGASTSGSATASARGAARRDHRGTRLSAARDRGAVAFLSAKFSGLAGVT